MPEHLRALCFILFTAIIIFFIGKKIACPGIIAEEDFNRRRNLWIGVTLSAFLAHNYWIYYIISAVLIFYSSRREDNKFALYLFLLVALPNLPKTLMFGNVKIFEFDYMRLLSMSILFPAFINLDRISPQAPRFGKHKQDIILLLYLVLGFILTIKSQKYTSPELVRFAIYLFLGGFLPYYIASRALNNLQDMRDALMSFAVACMVIAAIGFLEFSRHWILYKPLKQTLSVEWGYLYYLARGSYLRAMVTGGQPIALGYIMAVAFGVFLFFSKTISPKMLWITGFAVISMGLLSALSRGPWLGAAVMVIVYSVTSKKAATSTIIIGTLMLLVFTIASSTNVLDKYIDYLPFIGTVDSENVEFRKNLLIESIDIIMKNPFWGDMNADLELFRTGENIIDIVNNYVLIAIQSGFIGLGLFIAFFLTICMNIYNIMRKMEDKENELYRLGQILLSVLLGILFILSTVCEILAISYIYYAMVGTAVAYIRLAERYKSNNTRNL